MRTFWRHAAGDGPGSIRHAFVREGAGYRALCSGYRLPAPIGQSTERPWWRARCPYCDAREMLAAGAVDPLPESR